MISKTLKEIAVLIDGKMVGENVTIMGLKGIKEAESGDLTFLADSKYLPLLAQVKASAIIVSEDMAQEIAGLSYICVKDPVAAFSKIVDVFLKSDHYIERGIHSTVVIGDEVHIGQNVSIGPHVIIQKGVRIGNDTIIHGGCFIGYQSQIGFDCEIYPNVTIRERVKIGNRVILHSGVVLGADGFGYQTIDGKHVKIPQVGIVRIEDDVEIGANSTVDRARLHETVIGAGTKIDNLVQIAHNVIIGKNCFIISQAGIAGSAVIEDNVIIAGQVGVSGHTRIGKGAVVAGQSGIVRDIKAGEKVMGMPARPHLQMKRIELSLDSLPEGIKKIREFSQRIQELEEQVLQLQNRNDS